MFSALAVPLHFPDMLILYRGDLGGTKEVGQAMLWQLVRSGSAFSECVALFLSMSGMLGRQCCCLSLLSVCLDMCGPATSLPWRGNVERPIEPELCRLPTEHCCCGQDAEN